MQLMNEKDRESIKDMRKYNICILGVSEIKWKKSGARDIEDHPNPNPKRLRGT